MTYIAIKVPVIESELGWGRKIDDWMVCIDHDDAENFKEEFNSKNTAVNTPDWYMQVEGNFETITLNKNQYLKLAEEKRVWLSNLRNVL